jgi:hypothetical protein
MSVPFIVSRIPCGEIDSKSDLHIRRKGNRLHFPLEKYDPKAGIGVS